MSKDDPDGLNMRAVMALGGATLDWQADLTRLLRSDIPLDRMLRDRMADAIENESDSGPRLELKGHKKVRDRLVGAVARHQWMEIGRSIQMLINSGSTSSGAIQFVADRAGVGLKKAEQALEYHRKVDAWVTKGLKSEAGTTIGREWLEHLHHSVAVDPTIRALNKNLLEQLGLSQ